MLTRRTVLLAGSGLAVAGAAVATVGLDLRRRSLALELATLTPLVGRRFAVDGRVPVTLTAITGHGGGAPRADAFTLTLTADAPVDLPGSIRTLRYDDRDLVLYLGPVGADRALLEAVVDRTV